MPANSHVALPADRDPFNENEAGALHHCRRWAMRRRAVGLDKISKHNDLVAFRNNEMLGAGKVIAARYVDRATGNTVHDYAL